MQNLWAEICQICVPFAKCHTPNATKVKKHKILMIKWGTNADEIDPRGREFIFGNSSCC